MESMILDVLKEIVSNNCSIVAVIDQCDGFGIAMGSFIFTFKYGDDSSSYEVSSVPMTEEIGITIKTIIDGLIKEILNNHFSKTSVFLYDFMIKNDNGDNLWILKSL